MATAADVAALEADVPWLHSDFRAGLDALRESTAVVARRFADDMTTLAWLAAQVPRCPGDERGATPWTSFLREVAVARTLSDRGAAAEVRAARALTQVLPRTLEQLQAGRITVQRARAFITELEALDDDIATRIDAELAQRVAGLPLWRITREVRRAAARLDPDAAAQRTTQKNASRGVSLLPDADDQASVTIVGPAVPLTRWYESLDSRARALKQAGDPRGLEALRFDLATSSFPCATHAPVDPASGPAAGYADAGRRPVFVEAASNDCRMSRPVQASISVPVETALGLSNEPGWLDGYGWLSAPTCRLLLVDAELRQICVQSGAGQLVTMGDRDVRPPPTPAGVRSALLEMVLGEISVGDLAWRTEDQHDPPYLFVRWCRRATGSATGRPARGGPPCAPTSITRRRTRKGRPRRGTPSPVPSGRTSSSTPDGRRCAPPRRRCGSARPVSWWRRRTTRSARPASTRAPGRTRPPPCPTATSSPPWTCSSSRRSRTTSRARRT